jgi:potassium efflux system protein
VPNSQLISDQVTNWMLRDLRGRVCVPIRVAYGSDTAEVKRVLLSVAHAHPAPIKDGSLPEPKVFFMRYEDSALEFELRFFIRHVDERLNVISDMNFAIDAAFPEAGIQIPYPIRDVRMKSWLGTAAPLPPTGAMAQDLGQDTLRTTPFSGKNLDSRGK